MFFSSSEDVINSSEHAARRRPGRIPRKASLADNLGLRYRRVANLVHPGLQAANAENPDRSAAVLEQGRVKPLGGALSRRYFEQVSQMEIDKALLTGPAHAEVPEAVVAPDGGEGGKDEDEADLCENEEEAEKVRALTSNLKPEAPPCQCFPDGKAELEPDSGPYYTHLGVGPTVEELRRRLCLQIGCSEEELRTERAKFVPTEGKGKYGCPVVKYVIRRSSLREKYLAVLKRRQGHSCANAVIVVALVAWDGVARTRADDAYETLKEKLGNHGLETWRKCGSNTQKLCGCQGISGYVSFDQP